MIGTNAFNASTLMSIEQTKTWKGKKKADYENNESFMTYYCQIMDIALRMFKFNNLPNTCYERALLYDLICSGKVAFYNINSVEGASQEGLTERLDGIVHSLCNEGQILDFYYRPTTLNVFSNSFNGTIPSPELFQIVRFTPTEYPLERMIVHYCKRISDNERTLDVIAKGKKQPFVISADEAQVPTVEAVYSSITDNNYEVIVDKKNNIFDGKNLFPVSTTGNLAEVWEHRTKVINEFLGMLGINNTNEEKRERLLTDEVNANNEFTAFNMAKRIDQVNDDLKQVNAKFGTNISFELSESFKPKEVDNGEVHEGTKVDSGQHGNKTVPA